MTTETIHKLADSLGVSWDGDKHFMDWCSQIVGKKHLDDMTSEELLKIYNHIKSGMYGEVINQIKNADYVMQMMNDEKGKL